MSFFYNLNKTLDAIREKPELTHGQLNERDMGKHNNATTGFKALAAKTNGKIAGSQFQKMKKAHQLEETGMDEGAYQGGPDKSQIPAVNRPGNKMTLQDLEKERNQSPTTPDGMRALQNKLKNIHPIDEVGDTPAGLAAVQKVGQRADRALGDAGTGYAGSELANPDKTFAARGRANAIAGRERIRANDKNPTRVVGGPDHGNRMEEGGGAVNFDKVLDAIAALYGDDMWENDAMQDLANDLEQAGPTDKELDFIIAKGKLPKRLAGTQFSAGDNVRFGEGASPMSAKQKSFAALAPPYDKKTFADKIAGAKNEVDEMLGDVAAEAMKKALGGGMGRSAEMEEKEDLNPFTNYKKPRRDTPRVGDTEHGSKHDIKHGTTDPRYSGRMVTRRTDDQGMSVGSETDDEGNKKEKQTRRGAPEKKNKKPERVTANATKHKDGRKVKEGDFGPMEEGSGDLKAAVALLKKAGYKISKAVEKEKTTTRDDHAEKAGKRVAKDIEYDEKKDKKDDKPKKVKEAGGTDTPTASSGFSYGKGIYDSINHEIEKMIAESMNISMNSSSDGTKSLTITATDEDAVKLSMLLNTSGIDGDSEGYGGGGYKSACGDQEMEMDEAAPAVSDNEPDWPTNTEEGDALQYSGGLDGPKSTGQSTLTGGGIPNLDADRQHGYAEAEEDALHRMMEMAGIKKKEVDEEKTAEGNLFTKGLEDNNVKVGEKIPGTNAIKKKDIDESIFTLTNQWKAYKG